MNDRVYPSSKPQPLNGSTASAFPATKAQLYGATRPAYRPQPPPRRSRRSCCCRFCCWLTLILVAVILLLAIAGAVVWVLYRPHHPDFSVAALQISTFNLTSPKSSSPRINALINLSLLAKNPNKKLVFLYDPMSVTVYSSGVQIGQGSFPGFLHGKKNTTTIKAALTSGGAKAIDSTSAGLLSSDLKNGGKLPIEIKMETKVRVKIGGMKTEKVGIRVSCDGIQASVPKGKEKPSASDSAAKCKVKLRIKIWKWKI